jgi:glycosidase
VAEPSSVLAGHLSALYGADVAPTVAIGLERILARWRGKISPSLTSGLSERDVVLITYGDQVRDPGTAPIDTLRQFLERTAADVVNTVHVLPFFPSSSDDGFSVLDYRAVDPELGTWEDIERLGHRFRLMFDAVINHASVQGAWFQAFLRGDPPYRTYFLTVEGHPDLSQVVRPRAHPLLTSFRTDDGERAVWTTFSADQADLDYRNPEVLLAVIDILLFYIARGASLLRLDAIAYLWKEVGTSCIHLPQTHRVIRLLRAVLAEVAPHVLLVTETNVAHEDNVAYFGSGTDQAHLVYNFALPPLVLHALRQGSGQALSSWAAGLTVPGEQVAFFNFLASHDGIGLNPVGGLLAEEELAALTEGTLARGGGVSVKRNPDGTTSPYELNINYFDALSDPQAGDSISIQVKRFLTAHAIMLALPGIPGIYFHSLYGSRGWPEGVASTGSLRAINRQKLERARLESELSNTASLRAQVLQGITRLVQARAGSKAFHPAAPHTVLDCGEAVFAVARGGANDAERVVCLHNLTRESQHVRLPPEGLPGGRATEVWASVGQAHEPRGESITLGAYETVWLRLCG